MLVYVKLEHIEIENDPQKTENFRGNFYNFAKKTLLEKNSCAKTLKQKFFIFQYVVVQGVI